MPPAWEEHGRFIPSKASHISRLGLSMTHYVGRDVDVLFVALDANFRLRCRAVSSNEKDPSLSEGWGYFVYDIACQWHKALYQWMDKMPTPLQLNLRDRNLTFLVPKFHLPAHIPSCQWSFSFNWSKGVRRTDGEEPEWGWANLNPAASSTKDMGPGHCHDTLDDYFGDWNWKKLIGLGLLPFSLSIECFSPALLLGPSILRKIKEAVPKGNDH